ncbi:MAG TPA: flagellar basal body P-ring protein FlgI [Zoogloea sp.]|uniref:flagellar basal body P-ring protein FlgI n=1 Tax=Zoogloea sp. TaxID=49181 RepID=UPI002BC45EF1|nr:flagellar basal body P-ring protein FlgI [Zoogloea sp.]HOB45070.1 flagellar basal body P-ring protein FlgI [Zoogloea sp.]HQA12407.1 flagellar basal body P-ring protein FlgI [Zoogloea sp.]HQE40178.1 flagellar basal body P-ring protein FlgI [Zoogloea sp.]
MFLAAAAALCLIASPIAGAERLKDLASIGGVRQNQLIGYGLVVGLDGSGDQTTQTPFTVQSIINMLGNLGITLPPGQSLQLKNVAAVMVTSSLPPFARPGQQIDVTVSSMGNARSLKGGTLLMTPLKGADGQVYAMAQGSLAVSGAGGAAPSGGKVTVNHLSAGRIPGGATVERAVVSSVGQGDSVFVELNDSDFGTAQKVVDAINAVAPGSAQALDGRQIQVRAPDDINQRVAFLGRLENLDVVPAIQAAKVIVNSRTGSVVMNQKVALQNCAVSHGSLTVTIGNEQQVSQPNAFSGGQTAVTNKGGVDIKQEGGNIFNVKGSSNLADVVKALNAVGANPLELIAILQAMKASGALRAELEVI